MITLLKIQNLALVENLVWEVGAGLVGITGETGAGKSIIVGALKLVLGERADRGLVRTGCEACTVEAVFDLQRPDEVNAILADAGLEPCESGQVVVRRVIGAARGGGGRGAANRQFVNCSPVTLGVLKAMGEHLVDLHGPHDHQSLLSRDRQLAMLDAYAGADKEAATYRSLFADWRRLCAERDGLANAERANEQEIDLLKHQIEDIESAELRPDEADELERRYRVASNSSHLLEVTAAITQALDDSEGSIVSSLSEVARLVRDLEKHDPATAEFTGSFDTALVELAELGASLRDYTDGLELDPSELAALEARLDRIETLKRKYGNTVEEVIAFGDAAREKLAKIEGRGEELERLTKAVEVAEAKLVAAAKMLSAKRRRGAPELARDVAAHLGQLGFKRAGFSVHLEPLASPAASGMEAIELQFSPNPGEPPKPLRVIASSGEMSRVMLAVKSALAREDSIPLLVFDEIDANVGGEIAQAVGAKMASLGATHQVIAITHLPQVASLADCQYVVTKEIGDDERTRSRLREVAGRERVAEIARMLGGSQKSARRHAENLLATAA